MSPTNHFGNEDLQPWTLARIYDDLVCRAEIQQRLNIRPHRLADWIAHRDRLHCPRPLKRIGHIDVYSLQEWVDWYATWEADHKNHKSFTRRKPNPKNEQRIRSLWGYLQGENPIE